MGASCRSQAHFSLRLTAGARYHPDPGGEAESIRKPKLISLNLNQLRSYEVPITRTVDQQQSDAATPRCLVKSGDGVNDLFRSSTAVSLAELIAVEIQHKEPNGR